MTTKLRSRGDWFIQQRSQSLATIYLTRRDDVVITEPSQDHGIDLEVLIKTRKDTPVLRFGVILKGTRHNLSIDQANAMLTPALEALPGGTFPYPVCLFFFQMDNDEGYFTWVAEPVVEDDGSATLNVPTEAGCRVLDTDAVDEIVISVSAWYHAFNKTVLSHARGRRRKKSPLEVLHGIIDGEAAFYAKHGKPPKLLRLPIMQAYQLAKLGREHLGDLAGEIMKEGVRVLEKVGLLGIKVKLQSDLSDFSFE